MPKVEPENKTLAKLPEKKEPPKEAPKPQNPKTPKPQNPEMIFEIF
jgi:hypothetical protein